MNKIILILSILMSTIFSSNVKSQEGWIQQNSGTSNPLWNVFFVNPDTGWAVGYNGTILKTTSGGMTSVQTVQNEMPNNFNLHQNYPNPFNPSTMIKYHLSKPSDVILNVYNLSGQELETLVNGFQTAGEHEITWQPKGLPSGIYFYRLQAGGFSETKKLILQK